MKFCDLQISECLFLCLEEMCEQEIRRWFESTYLQSTWIWYWTYLFLFLFCVEQNSCLRFLWWAVVLNVGTEGNLGGNLSLTLQTWGHWNWMLSEGNPQIKNKHGFHFILCETHSDCRFVYLAFSLCFHPWFSCPSSHQISNLFSPFH